jgi:coenzyme F420-reducing hydrogenase beta subunit
MLVLKKKVIKNGYCIGCGTCTILDQSPYRIQTDENGCYQAFVDKEEKSDKKELELCSFYSEKHNEDSIAKELFSQDNTYDKEIGYYNAIFSGQVADESFYQNGSSGGTAKWLLTELLHLKLVDYVIQVYNNDNDPNKLFEYRITSSVDEVAKGSKSVYYPVEMSGVLKHVKDNPGRYAITGVPCFIKSIRLLQINEQIFKERIKFCFGIFCGHLKSKFYAEMIGWQLGVEPNDLSYIDFRVKIPGKKANEKGVKVGSVNGNVSKDEIVQNIYGTNYGYGFFRYPACDFCDDVIGETADISFGDAWLPEFLHIGTSMVVCRNPILSAIIEKAIEKKQLNFQIETPHQVYISQEGGYRHRRDGLAVRLKDTKNSGKWIPTKRFTKIVSDKQRIKIFRKRTDLANTSFIAFKKAKAKNDFEIFKTSMEKEVNRYKRLYIYPTRKLKIIYFLKAIRLYSLAILIKRGIKRVTN